MEIKFSIKRKPDDVAKKRPSRVDINSKIVKTAFLQTRQGIQDWNNAVNRARSESNPSRTDLMNVYRDISIDGHLTGIITSIKRKAKGREFKIVDENGNIDKELTKKFKKKWFDDYIDHAIDSVFYGYSLIGLGNIDEEDIFDGIELIPREYVIPELGIVKTSKYGSTKDGIDFTKQPYSNWYILLCKNKKDLGLYHNVVPHCIGKKSLMLQAWDNAELFGIPIRVIKTDTTDEERRIYAEQALKTMGSNAAGVIHEDDDLQLLERDEGDAYKTFLEPYKMSNREISKAIAGQTMMFDEGSSRAQAEVHERLFNEIISSYCIDAGYSVNKELIPRMKNLGLIEGYRNFEWVEIEQVNVIQKIEMITKLAHEGIIFEKGFIQDYTGLKAEQGEFPETKNVLDKYNEIMNIYGTNNI